MRRLLPSLAPICVAVTFATPSPAADGVLEINQTCALVTGCFSGDTGGFPVTITTPGSYKLTSNLATGGPNNTGVSIASSNVTLNLAGFQIGCTVFTPPMTVQFCGEIGGNGRGVESDPNTRNIEVHSGTILGMGSHGVSLGDYSVVRNLRVSKSGEFGINVGDASTIAANNVYENQGRGIEGGLACTVESNSIYQNVGIGLIASAGSMVSRNSIAKNGSAGISGFGGGMVISDNAVYDNGGGVGAFDGSIVRGNAISLNGGFGLQLTNGGYRENVIVDNAGGTVSLGVDLDGNLCDTSTSCP